MILPPMSLRRADSSSPRSKIVTARSDGARDDDVLLLVHVRGNTIMGGYVASVGDPSDASSEQLIDPLAGPNNAGHPY
jgi:hypothetical protein